MTQYAFHFDSNSCTGCKACQVACKEAFQLPVTNLYRKVYNYQGGSWTKGEAGFYVPQGVFGYFVSMSCNHCSNPACVENCPTGAMQKDAETGIVWTDHEACIGCQTCQTACPYDAPTYDEDAGYMLKCDMCKGELAHDRAPICSSGCPMRALDWGTLEDMVAKYGEGDMEIEPLPLDTTGPNMLMTPHVKAVKAGSGGGFVANLEEEL